MGGYSFWLAVKVRLRVTGGCASAAPEAATTRAAARRVLNKGVLSAKECGTRIEGGRRAAPPRSADRPRPPLNPRGPGLRLARRALPPPFSQELRRARRARHDRRARSHARPYRARR